MNRHELPPGFAIHQASHFRHNNLLLPTRIVHDLEAEEIESAFKVAVDEDKDEINQIIKRLLTKNKNATRTQIYEHLLNFSHEHDDLKAVPTSSKKRAKKAERFLQVFDMEAIKESRSDNQLNRTMQSILKKFKDSDDGRRIIKCVPKNFRTQLKRLKKQYPNCIEFLDYIEAFVALSLKQAVPEFYFPPVLIVGPPGIGKTAVVGGVADAIGVGMRQLDLASTTAGFVIGGMSSSWTDAKTGFVIDQLRDGSVANPIFILDEIDKASGDAKHNPLGPLYSLLEQNTAACFIDEALGIPSDVSKALFVATANNLDSIPKPILSRFIVVRVEDIKVEQHAAVTQSIYESLLRLHSCQKLFARNLTNDIIEALREHSPRVIKAMLRRALANAAIREPHAKKLSIEAEDLLFSAAIEPAVRSYDGSDSFGFIH